SRSTGSGGLDHDALDPIESGGPGMMTLDEGPRARGERGTRLAIAEQPDHALREANRLVLHQEVFARLALEAARRRAGSHHRHAQRHRLEHLVLDPARHAKR